MATIVQTNVDISEFSQTIAALLLAESESQAAPMRLLQDEALTDTTAPKVFSGCLSALSSYEPLDHAYTDALKNYGEVYEQFQAYLEPLDTLSAHDYDQAIAMSMPEHAHLGCLNDDMVEFVASSAQISDEEIENCGYMGWLQN